MFGICRGGGGGGGGGKGSERLVWYVEHTQDVIFAACEQTCAVRTELHALKKVVRRYDTSESK